MYVQELSGNTKDKDSLMSPKPQKHDQAAWSLFGFPIHSFSSTETSVSNIQTHQFRIVNENKIADLKQKNHDSLHHIPHGDNQHNLPHENQS